MWQFVSSQSGKEYNEQQIEIYVQSWSNPLRQGEWNRYCSANVPHVLMCDSVEYGKVRDEGKSKKSTPPHLLIRSIPPSPGFRESGRWYVHVHSVRELCDGQSNKTCVGSSVGTHTFFTVWVTDINVCERWTTSHAALNGEVDRNHAFVCSRRQEFQYSRPVITRLLRCEGAATS